MTETTSDELDERCAAAQSASEVARRATTRERASWLRAIAAALDSNVDELVHIAAAETHLGLERLEGEVARTSGQLRHLASVIEEGSFLELSIDHARDTVAPRVPDLRRMLIPLGPVAVFSASNFPFAFSVAGGDTASAIAAGCSVVVKAHSGHPQLSRRTTSVIDRALDEVGAPIGLVSLVEGTGAGAALVMHPVIRAVGFTGSLAGGRALFDRAMSRPDPIPFFGELGSINPVVITPGADSARGAQLAEGLAQSFQLGAGQFCTKPGVVLVPRDSNVERHVGAHVRSANETLLTDRISAGFVEGVTAWQRSTGVELIAGEMTHEPGSVRSMVFAVDAERLTTDSDALLAEVFGPTTLLVRYRDVNDVPRLLEDFEGSLTGTIHAEPDEDVSSITDLFVGRAGRIVFNGWPTGVAVTWSQHHGGPWPATTSQFTSVGATGIRRFLRPITFQDAPEAQLPPELWESNPLGLPRRIDGELSIPDRRSRSS
ncbi:MAG: aldehyde dehydrogenase (NADP(+)) [Microcella sp.]|uniref:aldehyde dehydrogenase (NADP(+)) n=1 Tax=Microcella sp. TaxID=1913979 RepID=UPI0024CC91FE|nr:aldehyde dehydrogenase (NADP(+)) [Microcella sp.]UYN82517.1 MAG: aldehyde dehydrogenase (NADP(+)) [Microcella sp.]